MTDQDRGVLTGRIEDLETWRIAIDKRNVHSDDLIADFEKLQEVVLGNGKDGITIKIDRIERDMHRVLWGISVVAVSLATAMVGLFIGIISGTIMIIHR